VVAHTLGGANRETATILTVISLLATPPRSVASRRENIAQGDNMRARFTLSPPKAPRAIAGTATALLTVALITACSADKPAPTGLTASLDVSSRNGVPFTTEGLASPAWQASLRSLVSAANFSPLQAVHAYPILGVAQYLAVQQADAATGDGDGGRRRVEAERGAVAGASIVTMSYLFPTHVQEFEDLLTAQANAGPGKPHPGFAEGEAIGRAAGAAIVARAIGDGFSVSVDPPPPVGPGFWTTNAPGLPVAGGQFPGITPWFLTSANQFRPAAPPAFGSAAFNTGLAEIRNISDTRTAEQTQIAAFWALNAGTPTASGFWLSVPTDSGWVAQHGMSEREVTHLYALTSATMMDATIGCWDAKLFYWLIRPWKADPLITTTAAVGKPNHPSYPSGHSCVSSSGASVLSVFFPEKTAQLDAMVIQAGLSRMYGGIHYRFDIDAGQRLGRSAAAYSIAADASGNSVLTPR
jgi:membrane-associated phospholipid phosphatase